MSEPDSTLGDIEVGRYALRTFMVKDNKLSSLYQRHYWEDGVAVAKCTKRGVSECEPPQHSAPEEKCTCGLYGTLTLDQLLSEYHQHAVKCVAVFAAEGISFIGTKGLRTAAARVVAYWCADTPSDGSPPAVIDHHEWGKLGEPVPVDPNRYTRVFTAQCPEAKHFTDIHEMLAQFHFPAYEQDFPPPAPLPREAPPMYPQQSYALGNWDKMAPHMKAATPAGIAVVKALMEGKII